MKLKRRVLANLTTVSENIGPGSTLFYRVVLLP